MNELTDIYGAWWKLPKEVRFYLDWKYVYWVKPRVAWVGLERVFLENHPLHTLLDDTDSFAVDIDPGFLLRHRLGNGKIRGTRFYFDANLRPCDNYLFSRTPLSSAEFVVVVWDKAASEAFGLRKGLRAVWYRKTNADFAKHAKVD